MEESRFPVLLREPLKNPWFRLARVGIALVLLTLYGTVGYAVIEHYQLLDAVFMTIITISTVGYGEIHPLTPRGEIFTITLILLGVIGFLYTLGVIVDILSGGDLEQYRRYRKMHQALHAMRDHIIVCGYGRIGRNVVREIHAAKQQCVVIERDPHRIDEKELEGDPVIIGDAASDEVLRDAGLEHARALVSCVDSDERNVYVVLTARTMNPRLYIVARSSYAESYQKLLHAGANRVLSPYVMSGRRMAIAATQPLVGSSMQLDDLSPGDQRYIEEIVIPGGWSEGISVAELQARGGTILMVRSHTAGEKVAPPPEMKAVTADHIVAAGTPDQLHDIAHHLWKPPGQAGSTVESTEILD